MTKIDTINENFEVVNLECFRRARQSNEQLEIMNAGNPETAHPCKNLHKKY